MNPKPDISRFFKAGYTRQDPLDRLSDRSRGEIDGFPMMSRNKKPGQTTKPPETQTAKTPRPNRLQDAYQQWKTAPGPKTMGEVLREARPVIDQAVTSYAGGDAALARSRARVLATQAVKSYDPNQGTPLKTYLQSHMKGLQRYRANQSPIKSPERMRLENIRIHRAEQEFKDVYNREPEPDELSEMVNLPWERIQAVRKAIRPQVSEGQLTQWEGSDEDDSAVYLPGVPDDSAANTWASYVYHDLDPIDKRIYNMYLGRGRYKKGMSVQDMAKELKMSSAAVSQRAKRISAKLEQGISN